MFPHTTFRGYFFDKYTICECSGALIFNYLGIHLPPPGYNLQNWILLLAVPPIHICNLANVTYYPIACKNPLIWLVNLFLI